MLPEVEFDFDESVVDELINGECWSLASVLHHRSGLPFAALYGDGEIVHVGVELGDGMVVDVEGIWESAAWESVWLERLDDVWEIYSGFVTDDLEDREVLLGYSPSLELVCMGDGLGTLLTESWSEFSLIRRRVRLLPGFELLFQWGTVFIQCISMRKCRGHLSIQGDDTYPS